MEQAIDRQLGPYELLEELGRGGMATVYRAYHAGMDRYVAVKIVHSGPAADAAGRERFQREARMIARLEHAHILPIYDYNGAYDPPYIVMRYLSGGTLREQLGRGQLPVANTIRILRQVAGALDYAHRQGIIHRDLKPSNIIFDGEGDAFLTDFGIARLAGPSTGTALTQTGAALGTPGYMAPEQGMGRSDLGPPVDTYALGVILFELLTGALPYDGETPLAVMLKHVQEPVPSATAHNPNLPAAIDRVIARAMAKAPAARYPSAIELVGAAAAVLDSAPITPPGGVSPVAQRPPLATMQLPKAGEARSTASSTHPSRMPVAQNKQVTVLYADAAEFARMLDETLEVEAVRDRMGALWAKVASTLAGQGGAVVKRTDETIAVLWGTETAHEDDPERAIRAALALREATRELAIEGTLPLQIGVTTGTVLLTPTMVSQAGETLVRADYSASGPPMSAAARLATAVPEGGVVASHDTYRLVRGVFDVEPLPPLRVRGRAQPIDVYLVNAAKQRAFRVSARGVEGIETRMIGREGELRQLQEAFEAACEDGEAQLIAIVGAAGLGKSRLLDEFQQWVDLRPQQSWLFKGRATPESIKQPYALLRDVFTFRCAIQESDNPAAVQAKLEQGVATLCGPGHVEQAHIIGQLLGFDLSASPYLQGILNDAEQLRDRGLRDLMGIFGTAADGVSAAAAVFYLEDLHWADDASLDVLGRMLREHAGGHLLIVGTARPALLERRPAWGVGESGYSRIELRPLAKRDSRKLVKEVLQKVDALPDALRDLLVERAEGNPFYVEELVKVLIDDRVIVKGSETWAVADRRLAALRVPPTLTGVLQARLDRLTPDERTVLQRAAVLGSIFWDQAVAALEQGDGLPIDIDPTLALLQQRELIGQRPDSAFVGSKEYLFASSMVRDVAYAGALKRQQRAYHALAAGWLIAASGTRVDEYANLIAEHYTQADEPHAAATWYAIAGGQAAARFANGEAVAAFSRALEIIPEADDAVRYELLCAREEVYHLQAERAAQARDLDALTALAEQLADQALQADVALRRAAYANATGDYEAASVAAQQAAGLARAAGAALNEARSYLAWGEALLELSDYPAARMRLRQALEQARAADRRELEAAALRMLGTIAKNQGDYGQARSHYEQSLELFHAAGDRRGESMVLHNLGTIMADQGDFAAARTYLEQSLEIKQAIGDRAGESRTLNNLGNLTRDQGDLMGARAAFEQALQLYRAVGDRRGEGLAIGNLGMVAHQLGEHAAALEAGRQSLQIARMVGDRDAESFALLVIGHALAGLGQLDAAAEAYNHSLTIQRALGQEHLTTEPLAGLARVALARGEPAQALAHVEAILAYLAAGGTLDGTEEPFRVELTCYQTLLANGDPRAGPVLAAAYARLQERAARLDETSRPPFLEQVPAHRAIVAAANGE